MAEPFISEIRILAINFAPHGWAVCDGAILPINQNHALFALIGTSFGGDGMYTFALPDLRARAPMHRGKDDFLGATTGGAAPAEPVTGGSATTHPYLPVGFYIAVQGIFPTRALRPRKGSS